ncbi:DUF2158 domain-containing protein [Porticoccus sp.]
MRNFKKGDTVMIKSGGPIMTIQDLGDYSLSCGIENGAMCIWFIDQKPMEKVFDLDTLELYES